MVSPPFRGSSPYPHGSLTYRIRFIVSHHPPNGKPFFRKRRIFFALSGKAPRAAALGMQGFRAAAKNIRRPYSLLRRDPAGFLMSIHFSLFLCRLLPGLFFRDRCFSRFRISGRLSSGRFFHEHRFFHIHISLRPPPGRSGFPSAACVRHLFAPHCIEEKRFL